MKRFLFLLVVCLSFPAAVSAQGSIYPWVLGVNGGGAIFCTRAEIGIPGGCFAENGPPMGLAIGASFGRAMNKTWSFELEGSYWSVSQNLPARVDPIGIIFVPILDRTRGYGGFSFLGSIMKFGRSDLFIAIGFVAGVERQIETTPPGIFHTPTVNIGLKAGLTAGAGINWWFSESWGIRPEARFILIQDLTGLRFSGGILKKF